MKVKLFFLVLLFSSLCCASIASADYFSSAALLSAETFVSAIDNDDYQSAYAKASDILRLKSPQSSWIGEQRQAFQLLGKALERQLISVRKRDSYPSMPDGHYLIVYYQTKTEHKSEAAEVLLLKQQEQGWLVCKYSIR